MQAAVALGGTISSGALAASAACTAALASRSPPAGRAVRLHRAAFLPGGPTHGAGFGLLLTALGMAGHRTGQLPPPLASAALASAVPNLLAPIYLGDGRRRCGGSPPAGRFPGLIITATAGRYVGRVR